MQLHDLTNDQLIILKATLSIMMCCLRRLNDDDVIIGNLL